MTIERFPRRSFSERASGKSKWGWALRVSFCNTPPAQQPCYLTSCLLCLLLSTQDGDSHMDYGTFLSILRQLIILLLTCLRGLKLKHREIMQLSQSRSTGGAELGQISGLRLTFNLMRSTAGLLSQHGVCLVTEALTWFQRCVVRDPWVIWWKWRYQEI